MTVIGWLDANCALYWSQLAIIFRPWSPSVPPRTPAKVGRLRAGQLDRFCGSRWLDRVATDDFVPLDWLSARTPIARDAAATIRRAR